MTSRIIGFQAVRGELAAKYDHLLVAPLDGPAKQRFIERWSKYRALTARQTASLIQKVSHSRTVARLTSTIFHLAVVAQIHEDHHAISGRRVDIYRQAVQLMLHRRRPNQGPPLSANELLPHLEFLAYRMRRQGRQRFSRREVLGAFEELRQAEAEEKVLSTRAPADLLDACVDATGILHIAGTEVDARGYEHEMIQFSHQSFQEYFAGQALRHERDGSGQEGVVARLRSLLTEIEIGERSIQLNNAQIGEPVIAEYWQEAIRMCIADLSRQDADDAIMLLLPDLSSPPVDARARAVFALQCLVDEPNVSDSTLDAVFDTIIECLEDYDRYNDKENSALDETLTAVTQSAFVSRLKNKLMITFIAARGELRNRVGRCAAVLLCPREDTAVTPHNAEAIIKYAIEGLASPDQQQRIQTALVLVERFYAAKGWLGFLEIQQQQALIGALLSALHQEEATREAAMWALSWLTGALRRMAEGNLTMAVHLTRVQMEQVETFLNEPDMNDTFIALVSLILNREEGTEPVGDQLDWIYELAVIADGAKPRRSLPDVKRFGRITAIQWLEQQLSKNLDMRYSCRIAQALGGFGVYIPAMLEPLHFLLTNARKTNDDRDEAAIYLTLIGTPEAASILIEAADTAPVDADDYLYTRGLFGLLLLDNVDVLAEQLRKAMAHSDLLPYAYCLAGSCDPRGRKLLEQFREDPNPHIRAAVEKAYALPWMSEAEE